jgi:hypothetical protein
MINLENCKRGSHPWENVFSTEGVMDMFGHNTDWCPICGTVRVYKTIDGRKIEDNTTYLVPSVAKSYDTTPQAT